MVTRRITTTVRGIECQRCEHFWTPRAARVTACPACKSQYFDTPRRKRRA